MKRPTVPELGLYFCAAAAALIWIPVTTKHLYLVSIRYVLHASKPSTVHTGILHFYRKKGKSFFLSCKSSKIWRIISNTVNSWFKKDLNLKIHLHKAFFSDDRFLNSVHKSFLNQTTLDLRKEKWSFLNREFTVVKDLR